ncbi:MAG: glycosyltransferase family 1 protein [Chloroflexota bacterium]
MTHIGLNAHLLSSQAGYRSAGIHGYIYNSLLHLPRVTDASWQFTAMVGGANPVQIDGITTRRAPFDTEPPPRRILWEQVVQPFQLGAYDLYHAMAFVAPFAPIKPPFVVTVYDLSFIHYPQVLSAPRRAYLRTFTANTVRRATRVIGISESTASDVVETFGVDPAKVDVAPPGTDFERFRPLPPAQVNAFRREKNLPEDFWLFLGTLEPRKNLSTLIHAYAQLPKDTRPALVLAGGKGWDYDDIFAAIAQRHLEAEVLLPGFIPVSDLPLWYNSASLFVYPSLYEGFGIPPLEAMACGTPVVVSDASSLPEVVGGSGGLTVPPQDVEAWVNALITALDDSAWHARASSSGTIAAQRYTWANTARQTLRSYQRAIGQSE